jgi:hypothetical protein
MKTILTTLALSASLLVTRGVEVVTGPVTNSTTGNLYFLLSGSTWTEAEAKAIELGGHLVTINDAAENDWVFNTFGSYGGVQRELWIGLNDAAQEGTFVWSSGQPVTYTRWYPGEPNNYSNDDYTHIYAPFKNVGSRWNDSPNVSQDGEGNPFCGVVELSPVTPPSNAVQVITGPVTNQTSGHIYYLLSGSTWTEAEAKAIELGGHLVTISDAAENNWVFTNFGSYGGVQRELWIGLNDASQEGTFVWSSGQPVTYTRWYPGEPNNFSNDDYAHIWAPFKNVGPQWNDSPNVSQDGEGNPFCGVVEIGTNQPSVQIVTGPITNSANGHLYYLLSASTWPQAEAKAIELGGHLATINNLEESDWVLTTFGLYGGVQRELWIGLNDAAQEGTFVWSSGEPVTYTRWYPGEPNNFNNDDYAHIWAPFKNVGSQWNDANIFTSYDDEGNPYCGVVEVIPPNNSPIADASATERLVISPNGVNATVVLDGSQSSDPDGDPLTYAWFITGDSNALASGVVAVTSLPVGSNSLTLAVSDGLASGTQTFFVEVITTEQAVERLAALVAGGVANPKPLLATLRAAIASIDRSQPATAINQLQAFINKVQAQVAPYDPALAALLISEAQAIIDALNGGLAESENAIAITSIAPGQNGKPHLRIRGKAGRSHIVETSTDMVNWTKVGVASASSDSEFEFNDTQSANTEARFYRVVSPK